MNQFEINEILKQQLDGYTDMLTSYVNTKCVARDRRRKMGCFDVITYNITLIAKSIYKVMTFLREDQGINVPKFLDCGCGYGNIMLIAYNLGCDVYGIDLNEKALKLARQLTVQSLYTSALGGNYVRTWKVYRRNIQTYKDYSKYDIVYYFCPMESHTEEFKFEKWLADEMRVGAVIMPYYSTRTFDSDERFKSISQFGNYPKIKMVK